jgi:glycosyltransferase involved in cell wall biosynthesis
VLVVDNGSIDHTPQVVEASASRLPALRGFREAEPGLHAGRHAGMKAAQGDVLVFADDDIEALPTWLEAMTEAFSDPRVGMAGGNDFPLFACEPPEWIVKLWRPGFDGVRMISALSVIEFPIARGEISPLHVWGCNFAIRKSVLLEAGGFHPDAMPKELIKFRGDGETHISRHIAAAGLKCAFHAGASVRHKVTAERMTYDYFRQRGFNQGVSDSYTALRNRDHPAAPGAANLVRRIARRVMREVRDMAADGDVKRALQELKLGRREGVAFHRKAYREDAAVREWVHKPVYW